MLVKKRGLEAGYKILGTEWEWCCEKHIVEKYEREEKMKRDSIEQLEQLSKFILFKN